MSNNNIERKSKERYVPGPCLGTEKTMEHEGDNHTNRVRCFPDFLYWHLKLS